MTERATMTGKERTRVVQRVTWVTLGVNVALSVIKSVLGVLSGNQALVADGVHSASDALTDGLVLVGAPLWNAPPDDAYPYGHGRIETLLTLVIAGFLAAVGLGLVSRAIMGLSDPSPPQMSAWTLGAALLSFAVNEGLFQWSRREGERVGATILVANAWHHRSDGLSSLPVAASIVVQAIWPHLTFVDPLAAIIVSTVVLKAAWEIGRDAAQTLVDASASDEVCDRITEIVLEHPKIRSLHALRTRHIGPGLQVDLHIQVDPKMTVREGHDIAHDAQRALIERGPDIVDVLVHVEPDDGHEGGLTDDLSGYPPQQ